MVIIEPYTKKFIFFRAINFFSPKKIFFLSFFINTCFLIQTSWLHHQNYVVKFSTLGGIVASNRSRGHGFLILENHSLSRRKIALYTSKIMPLHLTSSVFIYFYLFSLKHKVYFCPTIKVIHASCEKV